MNYELSLSSLISQGIEMVTMPKLEQKLVDMKNDIRKTLKLILHNISTAKPEA